MVEEVSPMGAGHADLGFTCVEYSVVAAMLLLSTLVGVYYTFFKKQDTFKDYMLGGKTMGVLPVSMSIVASFLSGVTLLGLPTEIYLYGTQYLAYSYSCIVLGVLCSVFYLPVFYKLQLDSVFEYLELRFDHKVRILGMTMYIICVVTLLPTILYIPSLAFSQVSGVPVYIVAPVISGICIFYTTFTHLNNNDPTALERRVQLILCERDATQTDEVYPSVALNLGCCRLVPCCLNGGLRAVLWTDTLQNFFSLLALVFVLLTGCKEVGGVREVWRINQEGHRLELFDMDPNPFARNTFLTASFGALMFMTSMAVHPVSIQRFLSVPSLKQAKRVVFWSTVGYVIALNLMSCLGLVLYARYHGCDPVAAGVSSMDPNPFARITFLTASFGALMFMTSMAVHPVSIQRFLSVPSLKQAKRVVFWSTVGYVIALNLMSCLGLVLYARYHGCDPVAAGEIKSYNQLTLMYVMEIGKSYPGLAGLFLSGALSAALSSVSSWLNTVGGSIYKDSKEVFFPNVQHSEVQESRIIKTIVLTLGIICVLLVFLVERFGNILQLAISILGAEYGPILSLFTLGIFFPRVNTKGAIAGTLVSFLTSCWIIFNAQYYMMIGKLQFPGKITSIDQCSNSTNEHFKPNASLVFNYTGVGSPVIADSSVAQIYQLSFNCYIAVGTVVGLLVGLGVSLCTEPPDLAKLNPDLFSTFVQSYLPRAKRPEPPGRGEYVLTAPNEDLEKPVCHRLVKER